jgi:glycine cleavage system T protein (aminomethyltransferase)
MAGAPSVIPVGGPIVTLGTAFHPRAAHLNQQHAWENWYGYHVASKFADSIDIEYNAVREAAGVIDVSPLFKYRISGPDSVRLIDRVITRDAAKLAVGQVYYTPWCDEAGKLIDDGTVARLDDTTYRWTAAEPNYRWFRLNATGLDVSIEDISAEVAAVALQGPMSRAILEEATDEDWADLRYFRRRSTTIGGVPIDVSRTGYTGDLGYELWMDAAQAVEVWDELFLTGHGFGIRPVGMAALDVLRIEAGLILLDSEFTSVRDAFSEEQEYSPFELGLARLVDFAKARFVGRRALVAEQGMGGAPRRLVGLELDWSDLEAAYARHRIPPVLAPGTTGERVPLSVGRRHVGKATSMTWSPILKRVIALAVVATDMAAEGARMQVEWNIEGSRERVEARVVKLPFLDLERKRI